MPTIKFVEENDDGDEVIHELPAKFEVCGRCEGHGTHLNPSIGNHAYSMEEFNDSFSDEEQDEYFKRGGRYDVKCEECGGERVYPVVDEDACDPEVLKRFFAHVDSEAAYEAECRAERRMESGGWDY